MKFEARLREVRLFSGLVFSLLFSVPGQLALAQYDFEVTPSLSIGAVYDDNIYLSRTDEISDYITTVSPGLHLRVLSEKHSATLLYSPTFVWYNQEDRNDTVRHSGTLTFGQNLTRHLRFDLTDTYLKSEDPLEETEGVASIRRTRNTYQRNSGQASFQYVFGPENGVTFGYRHSLLENEDVTLDDGTTQNPFGTVTYWFDIKNGLELDYEFSDANFSRDDESPAEDDYAGHGAGIRYIRRITRHTTGSLGYHIVSRGFEGRTEDYKVHEGSIDFTNAFSPDLTISLGGGYFVVKNERSNDETGYTYNASMTKLLERGSITIDGRGGWDEAYLEAESERRGFTRYWGAGARIEYQIMEPINGYAGGSHRRDRNSSNREWENWQGNLGLRWEFLRWFSLSLDYSYDERDDDVDTEDYKVNRVMLMVTARKLYRW
jgi:hypothetical protein